MVQGLAAPKPFGDPNLWRWAPDKAYHVEDYRLKLHFDQPKAEVFGDEEVTLTPYTSDFHRLYLDSEDMTIDSVSLVPAHGAPLALQSSLEDAKLWITLDKDYAAGDTLKLRIVYHGMPRFGLFFDNPTPEYPDTPREIWTQGEPEFNHHWFPCWDYPNDMSTSEVIATVPEGQVVVSNGRLVKISHAGSQVTYDWLESVPHSSYLTSLAIGPWEKVHDSYHGKPVDYYAARGTDETMVRDAFGLTPDMLGFFSRTTIEYPYEKYDQVAVHDFFFGGMENVSATTLRDWDLQDPQGSSDFPLAETVAHEMAQHWFGDYAQGRDWSDIWLNEGFATYFPALYTQYHEDYDAYRYQMLAYQDEALRQDREDYLRPIVDRHYTEDLQMLDSITHEKGSSVLDMLRYVIDGPQAVRHVASKQEPFFRALSLYLKDHAAEPVDSSQLLASLRAATGRDLTQFFQEWVYEAGTPAYKVSAAYDAEASVETVTVTQTQQGEDVPAAFHLPIMLSFHGAGGSAKDVQVQDEDATQSFKVPLDFEPQWVDFDPDGFIEKSLDFPQPASALRAAAEGDPSMRARLWAVAELGASKDADIDPAVATLTQVLTDDRFYGVRMAAAESLGALDTPAAAQALLAALSQKDDRVRTSVASALTKSAGDTSVYRALVGLLQQDHSYAVRAAAASAIGRSKQADAFGVLQAALAAKPEVHVARAIEGALAATGDPKAVPVLLGYARPGVSVRLRLSALSALGSMPAAMHGEQAQEIATLVGQTLHDPNVLLQREAQGLVATLHLTQYQDELRDEAQGLPSPWQRAAAADALKRLTEKGS
jgi:aminopeptidase N